MNDDICKLVVMEKTVMRKIIEADSREDSLGFKVLQEKYREIHDRLDEKLNELKNDPSFFTRSYNITKQLPQRFNAYYGARCFGRLNVYDKNEEDAYFSYIYEMLLYFLKTYDLDNQMKCNMLDLIIDWKLVRSDFLTNYFLGRGIVNQELVDKSIDEIRQSDKGPDNMKFLNNPIYFERPFFVRKEEGDSLWTDIESPEYKIMSSIESAAVLVIHSSLLEYTFAFGLTPEDELSCDLATSYLKSQEYEKQQNVMRL